MRKLDIYEVPKIDKKSTASKKSSFVLGMEELSRSLARVKIRACKLWFFQIKMAQ